MYITIRILFIFLISLGFFNNFIYAAKEIAILKEMPYDEVDSITTRNTKEFYQI